MFSRLLRIAVVIGVCGLPQFLESQTSPLMINSSGSDTVRFATYNLLNYPGSDASTRDPFFRRVIHSMKPDVIAVQEVTSLTGFNTFQSDVLNYYQSGLYTAVPFHKSTNSRADSESDLFYKAGKVSFVGANYITTDLRDIAEYILQIRSSGDTIHIFSMHLKASSGSTNEAQREVEAETLRTHLNNLPPGAKFILVGDFNIYYSTEPAMIKLTESESNNNGRAKDPLNLNGTWQDNPSFSLYHTQSTRTRSFGGGATGGLDDRFDLLLTSYSSLDNNILLSRYTSYGNDGNHLNDSINRLPNNAVPDSVANALAYTSDHLPVFCDFVFQGSGLPGPFIQISPFNNAPAEELNGVLTWQASSSAASYDVYLDGTNPPTTLVSSHQIGTSYAYSGLATNTAYYWSVVARDSAGTTPATGAPWKFTTVPPPPALFALTSPANGSTFQPVSGTLSWQASTYAAAYDVYLDQNNPPTTIVSSGQSSTSYAYAGLANAATYYWKVTAVNAGGSVAASNAPFAFTTIIAAPGAFSLLSPADGAQGLPLSDTLRWSPSAGAADYDVYLDTHNPPQILIGSGLTGTSLAFSGLSNGTVYYWNVVARNAGGSTTAAGPRYFTTFALQMPASFHLLSPDQGRMNENTTGLLRWTSSLYATQYDVYLDTLNPPLARISADQFDTTAAYQALEKNRTYYWNVIAKNSLGTVVSSDGPWNFTTLLLPGTFHLISPPDNALNVPPSDTMKWELSANAASYDVFIDVTNPPVTRADSGIIGTSYIPRNLVPATQYYWKVIAKNANGSLAAANAPAGFRTGDFPSQASDAAASNISTEVIGLTWKDNADNESGYRVYRATAELSPYLKVGSDLPANSTAFSDSGLSANHRYFYRIVPFNAVGEALPLSFTATTLALEPPPPSFADVGFQLARVIINPGQNPPSTLFAISVDSDTILMYVQKDGHLGGSSVWQDLQGWGDSVTISGLSACHSYAFSVQAMNEDGIVTPPGETASLSVPCFSLSILPQEGWNLLSLPVIHGSYAANEIFPGIIGRAFTYDGSYRPADSISCGKGYWVKLPADTGLAFSGEPVVYDSILLTAGWNLIGAVSSPVAVNDLRQIPPGVVSSGFFSYHGSYTLADSLVPASGYWVRAKSTGSIVLEPRTPLAKSSPTSEQPARDPELLNLSFEDQQGHVQRLSVLGSLPAGKSLDLPPLPPDGAFDVRFHDQQYAELLTGELSRGKAYTIDIRSQHFPVVVRPEGHFRDYWHVELVSDGTRIMLENSSPVTIMGNVRNLKLDFNPILPPALPHLFRLYQNYPNPFNPATVISYDMPSSGSVSIDVFNILGTPVASVLKADQPAGHHSISWNGSGFASGLYIYRLTVKSESSQEFLYMTEKPMILMK